MTPEDAKKLIDDQNRHLTYLEDDIARLARTHATVVLMALMRALIEMTCRQMGPNFYVHLKVKFYEGVLRTLRQSGIQ